MPYSSQLRTAPPASGMAASSKRQTMAAPGATRSPGSLSPPSRLARHSQRRSTQSRSGDYAIMKSTDNGNTWTIAGSPRCHAKCSPAGTCSASQGPRDHNDREGWVPDQLSLACMRVRGIRNDGYSLTAYRPGPSVIVTARGWVRLARVRVRASGSEGRRAAAGVTRARARVRGAAARPRLECPREIAGRDDAGEMAVRDDEGVAATRGTQLCERVDGLLVFAENRYLVEPELAVSHVSCVPLVPRHVRDTSEGQQADGPTVRDDRVRGVPFREHDAVHELAECHVGADDHRVSCHDIAYPHAVQRLRQDIPRASAVPAFSRNQPRNASHAPLNEPWKMNIATPAPISR